MNPTPKDRTERPILIAEDSKTQAELLHSALSEAGYDVVVTHSGTSALAAARRNKPALVISDVMMPGMDGYQLCRELKADMKLRDVPVMIVTSMRKLDDIVIALECGADNFIRKPFDVEALLARMEHLLANRRLRSHSNLQMGIEISLGGSKHLITADREQILDLLLSSYEEALKANQELKLRQREIQKLNVQLAARAVDLEDANHQLRAFGHTVSHDLRAPLLTIAGHSAILQRHLGAALDAKAKRYLDTIESETRRMKQIVEDVLYLANIDRSEINRQALDLAVLARDIMDGLREGEPHRQLHFECPGRAPAKCDERLARVALANLLGNAWKFTRKQPHARISFGLEEIEGRSAFFVQDNGAGFDMAAAEKLFKPFQRLHRNDEFDGFGIGLATVHRIVSLHQGRIWAKGAPQQGATFWFTLE